MLRRSFRDGQIAGADVIPAKDGIQQCQPVPDIGFRQYDNSA